MSRYRPGNPRLVPFSESSKTKSPSVGAIVGATIVGILGALLIFVTAIFAQRRCRRKAPSLSDIDDEGTPLISKHWFSKLRLYLNLIC